MISPYSTIGRIRPETPIMETRRIQDLLLTINNYISDNASSEVEDLITLPLIQE